MQEATFFARDFKKHLEQGLSMAGRAGRGKRDGNDVVKGREAARMKSEHLLRGGTGEMFRMTMVMSATVRRIYSYFDHHILIICR